MRGLAQCVLRPAPPVHEMVHNFLVDINYTKTRNLVGIHIKKPSNSNTTRMEREAMWNCVRQKYSDSEFPPILFLSSEDDKAPEDVPQDLIPYVAHLRRAQYGSEFLHSIAGMWILGHSSELFGVQGGSFLNAVRTVFPPKTTLGVYSRQNGRMTCHEVADMPCYKWWDMFRSRKLPEFNVSCFSSTSPETVICT
eukprot:Phypoly_transcript_09427.p1 GENE.Phypoly_transcript_09427~~Phypoly_transcript_09427.p1  ORF type:complete len:195 (+),score=24.33 Phypoly_transcript_09427:773-1357(+)